MRQALELSTTTQPAATAMGANFLEVSPPAENSAKSTSLKDDSVSSSTVRLPPLKGTVLPAEREEARAFTLVAGKSRLSKIESNS